MKGFFMKKKKLLILIMTGILVGIIVGAIYFVKMQNKQKIEAHQREVESRFHPALVAKKDTKLYEKIAEEYQEVGTIYQGTIIEVDEIQEDYYKIKEKEYYVYYEDFNPSEKKMIVPTNYLVQNKMVTTTIPAELYQESQKILSINKEISAKVIYKTKTDTMVQLNSEYFMIANENIKEEKEIEEDVPEKSEKISIFYFATEKNIEEKIKYLDEQRYVYLTEEEVMNFQENNAWIPKNSTMLVFEKESQNLRDIIQKYNLKVVYKEFLKNQYQDKDMQLSAKNKNVWYKVDEKTTINRFQDMLKGKKEVKEEKVPSVQNTAPNSSYATSIPVLNYHFFYDEASEACNESICLSTKNFALQLNYLKENGFKTLTMEEFNAWLDKKIELPKKSVLITVDDGAMGTDTHLPNLLKEYDQKATLFLITGWWPMSKYTTGNLEIQSHGNELHHNNYCIGGNCGIKGLLISQEEIIKDMQISKQTIGSPIAFCYPFYATNHNLVEAVKKEFLLAFVGGNKRATRASDKYKIPRYVVYKNTSLESFKKMVNP